MHATTKTDASYRAIRVALTFAGCSPAFSAISVVVISAASTVSLPPDASLSAAISDGIFNTVSFSSPKSTRLKQHVKACLNPISSEINMPISTDRSSDAILSGRYSPSMLIEMLTMSSEGSHENNQPSYRMNSSSQRPKHKSIPPTNAIF